MIKPFTKQGMRLERREAIYHHLWIIDSGYGWMDYTRLGNLKLVVRLYERQFYGEELRLY